MYMYMYTSKSSIYMTKPYLVGPDKLYKQSLDSAASRLLALISREYVQLV